MDGTVSAAHIDGGGNFEGVGTVYQIDAQGNAEKHNYIFGNGRTGYEVVNPTRDKIAIPWWGHLSACEEYSNLAVLSQKTGKVIQPDLPELPGNVWLLSSWFDTKGQVHAAFRSEPGCGKGDKFDFGDYRFEGERIGIVDLILAAGEGGKGWWWGV